MKRATLVSTADGARWVLTFEGREDRRAPGHPHRNYRSFRFEHLARQWAARRGIEVVP